MMNKLSYPFDSTYILKKKKSIRKHLLENLLAEGKKSGLEKRIAILGGSTTHDIKEILELFLLNYGIKANFYESEYAQYWQDAMFENPDLMEFQPDLIYIHTSTRNIVTFPSMADTDETIEALVESTYQPFQQMWEKLSLTYGCPVIQNNFELPHFRLLGNRDASDTRGKINFVNRLNERFYFYAKKHDNFHINDINYLAACYGLQKWADPFYWYMYKYACAVPAIPELCFNLANIIKSIYGKNKKAFVLDLDNTLWGGVVGDEGPDHIEIGQETPTGQIYSEFQEYLKAHKEIGIMLTVNSKNDEENALAGLKRPDSVLHPEDFQIIKANWNPKDQNLRSIAEELNIGTDSLVFVDDNPAERHIVSAQVPEAVVPEISSPETYIQILDRSGFFEVTNFSEDDLKRNEMYKTNVVRQQQQSSFENYEEYLLSLEMQAEIQGFSPVYMSRIAQLTNKSNQFNLTTKRCALSEIETIAGDPSYITLYGKLTDKFGDNGVVSVVFGHMDKDRVERFHIDLWLMSCRVLKRDMETAMMDALANHCMEKGIAEIYGYYYPTAKNKMVKEFYAERNFEKVLENEAGDSVWKLDVSSGYEKKNKVIKVED